VGDTNGALLSYRKAETLASDGAANDWDLVAKLVAARKRMATIETRSGHYPQAIALLTSALEPARRLWKEAPGDLQFEGQPAAALYAIVNLSLGHAMLNADNASDPEPHPEVLAQLKKTIAISEQIQAEHPGMVDLAAVGSEYAGFALEGLGVRTGDKRYFQEAVAAHRRGQESTCKAFQKAPDPRSQRNCADAFGELSWALHNDGEGEAAVRAAQRAVELMKPVSDAEPNSLEAQQDLANTYFHLGTAENTAGKPEDALGHLRIAEAKLRPLNQVPANDPLETVKLYIDVQRQIAEAQLGLHDVGGAVRSLQKGLAAAQDSAHPTLATVADLRARLTQATSLAAQAPEHH
jgi:tetratricopeptide (TPR) repeat protein